MGVENNNSLGSNSIFKATTSVTAAATTQQRLNSVGIYRPPAARRFEEKQFTESIVCDRGGNNNNSGVDCCGGDDSGSGGNNNILLCPNENETNLINKNNNNTKGLLNGLTIKAQTDDTLNRKNRQRERRPDRAVYVPRARRSLTATPTVTTNIDNNNLIIDTTVFSPISTLSLSSTDTSTLTKEINIVTSPTSSNSSSSSGISSNNNSTLAVDNNNSDLFITNCDIITNLNNKIIISKDIVIEESNCTNLIKDKCETDDNNELEVNCDVVVPKNHIENHLNYNNNNTICESNINKKIEMAENLYENVNNNKNKMIKLKDNDNEDIDDKVLQRTSKEINRSNRRIIKQTFNSDVLEINEMPINTGNEEVTLSTGNNINNNNNNNVNDDKNDVKRSINPEVDDWDTMFDENGDCLDPNLQDELVKAVGKVTIEQPRNDYKIYQAKHELLSEEEFPHVLEISNFPVEFKTHDIIAIFSGYKESGFDIKWVDDTHALAVFSSTKIAAEALAINHPFLLLKPLTEATIESRNKAKKCASSLKPYRARPETCAALARRLVTGALGVRLKTAREELENERRVLREAKERKLLAAKQRDEIWES